MNLKKILGNIGCAALGAIVPPFGGMAAKVLKDVLGLEDSDTEDDIVAAIEKATPEQIIKLQQASNKFKKEMKKLDIDIIKIDKLDVQNARGFARDLGTKTINRLASFNATIVITVAVGVGALLWFGKLATMTALEASILTLIIREAYGRYEQVCNFFFGSSQGSKRKSELMNKAGDH